VEREKEKKRGVKRNGKWKKGKKRKTEKREKRKRKGKEKGGSQFKFPARLHHWSAARLIALVPRSYKHTEAGSPDVSSSFYTISVISKPHIRLHCIPRAFTPLPDATVTLHWTRPISDGRRSLSIVDSTVDLYFLVVTLAACLERTQLPQPARHRRIIYFISSHRRELVSLGRVAAYLTFRAELFTPSSSLA